MPTSRRSPLMTYASSAVAMAALLLAGAASAQTTGAPAGFFIETEAQVVIGASDFAAGYVPSLLDPFAGRTLELDEGRGWGGALAIGYVWGNGWTGLVRYRHLRADDSGGPIDPGVIAYADSDDPFIPGALPIPLELALTRVDSETSIIDLEVGKDVSLWGSRVHLFGGLTYVSIDRDTAIIDTCSCAPLTLHLANTFQGAGPKVGARGGVPVAGNVRLVGGGSVAVLFGTAEFASRFVDPGYATLSLSDKSTRAVAALDADAGLAFPIGSGALTVGYRVNAMFGALDTDQRASPFLTEFGFPDVGDSRDDLIQHGPFARFKLPLGGAAD